MNEEKNPTYYYVSYTLNGDSTKYQTVILMPKGYFDFLIFRDFVKKDFNIFCLTEISKKSAESFNSMIV